MRPRIPPVLVALVAWAPAAHAGLIQIEHQPLHCVPLDRHLRVVARGAPADLVRGAELQFRAGPEAAWYATAMRGEAGSWSAVLPRPSASLGRFEYRIVMTEPSLETSATPPIAVAVGEDACASAAQAAVDSSIVVRVPPGAPVVPPVPSGFNPAGVVAAQEREAPKSKTKLALLGGLGAAGAIAAVALASAPEPGSTGSDLPFFAFNGTIPNPDSTISLSRDAIQVLVEMSQEPETPFSFTWRVEWRLSPRDPLCVSMAGVFNGAQRPTGLLLTAPLVTTGTCGNRFRATSAQITFHVAQRLVWDVTLSLPFDFEP